MTDTAQTPAAGSNTETPGSGTGSGSEDLKKQLEQALAEKADLAKKVDNLQSVLGRQGHELGNLRRSMQPAQQPQQSRQPAGAIDYGYDPYAMDPYGYGQPAPQPVSSGMSPEHEARLDAIAFKQDHPDVSAEDWNQMLMLLNDPNQMTNFAVVKLDGSGVDFKASYENAWRAVEIDRLRQMKAAAGAQSEKRDQQRDELASRAVVSGSGAKTPSMQYTMEEIMNMSSDEMLEKGIVQVDPNNPLGLRVAKRM